MPPPEANATADSDDGGDESPFALLRGIELGLAKECPNAAVYIGVYEWLRTQALEGRESTLELAKRVNDESAVSYFFKTHEKLKLSMKAFFLTNIVCSFFVSGNLSSSSFKSKNL